MQARTYTLAEARGVAPGQRTDGDDSRARGKRFCVCAQRVAGAEKAAANGGSRAAGELALQCSRWKMA